jgi:two-component system, NtrC family, nitrogen regulation response regulator GlnG
VALHNPAPRDLPGYLVTAQAPLLTILLLSGDPSLPTKLKHELHGATLTIAKDVGSIPRAAAKRGFDAVIVETKRNSFKLADVTHLEHTVDPSHAMLLAGPASVVQHASGLLQALRLNGNGRTPTAPAAEQCLETYLESKLRDFVRGMKTSCARNLHPMLIKAVERPLISLALKETNGNQIQAAQLLGMNRNTLRKKIAELRVPVNRDSARRR